MSYRELKSYQSSVIIYDFTVEFCRRFVLPPNRSDGTYRSYRMAEQMIQAARSGKQNIVEGSTERTSRKGELKLLGVARASFQELLEDYEDFLRQRSLSFWGKDSAKAREVRALAYRTDRTYKSCLGSPEGAANAMICLINQTNFLLDRQIRALENKFIQEGGYSEQLLKKRLAYRTNRTNKNRSDRNRSDRTNRTNKKS